MHPRGSQGLDFTPILTHYLFLFTTILAVVRLQSFPSPAPSYPVSIARMVHRVHIPSYSNRSMYVSSLSLVPRLALHPSIFRRRRLVWDIPPALPYPRCSAHPRNRCYRYAPFPNIHIRRSRHRICRH